MKWRWLTKEERAQRAQERRREGWEALRKESLTTKICGLVGIVLPFLFSLVVVFTAAVADEQLVQKPVWLSLLEAAPVVNAILIFVFMYILSILQTCGMKEEAFKPWGVPIICVMMIIITALWWSASLFAFRASPTCAANSSWLLSLTPSGPKNDWTIDQTMLNSCHFSIVSLSFAVINTVILTVMTPIGLADDIKQFLKERRERRQNYTPVPPLDSTSMETLVDRVDSANLGYKLDTVSNKQLDQPLPDV